MSLQERTLVIKNFDPDQTTNGLLRELCLQAGPIRNVVLKHDHAFVEFEDVESVGYCKALLDGVQLFGRPLSMEPKLRDDRYFQFTKSLNDYIAYDKSEREKRLIQEQQQESIARMRLAMNGQQTQFMPSQYMPIPMQMPLNNLQSQPIQQFKPQEFIPQQTVQLQQPPLYLNQQIHYQAPLPPQVSPYENYQAPPQILREQLIQTSPFIANQLRPPPEGRGYLPWLHEPHIDRARSLYNMNQNHYAHHQQQRRLSDRAPDFSKRRR